MKFDLKYDFIIAATLPLIVLVVSPLTIYFGNHSEYLATLSDVLPFLLGVGVGVASIFFMLLLLITRWTILHNALSGLLVGIALSTWIQSQLFAWNFGPLDGRGIDWNLWSTHTTVEIIVWIFVVTATTILAWRKKILLFSVAQGLLLLGILSLTSAWISSDYRSKEVEVNTSANADNNAFKFHSNHNTILIILDTFQADIFQEIAERWPDEVKFLRGFVFYPNTVGGFPTTQASIPLILTGKFYRNEVPIKKWAKANNASRNIADQHTSQGYGSSLVSMAANTLDGVKAQVTPMATLGVDSVNSANNQNLLILDGGLFRSLPTSLKPGFYDEGNWFFSRIARVQDQNHEIPPGGHGVDYRFLLAFEKGAEIASDKNGEFRLYHYLGTHWPLQVNENYEYEPEMMANRESFVRQSRGALSLLRRKLDRLKNLGIYDSARILVVGDHGSKEILPNDVRTDGDDKAYDISDRVLASSRPLLLLKRPASSALLSNSDEPMHLADVVCLLTPDDDEFECDKSQTHYNSSRTRSFYFYDWSEKFGDWNQAYMPAMSHYEIRGDVRDVDSWRDMHTKYENGKVKSTPQATSYNIDSRVDFTQNGNSEAYIKRGWGGQQKSFRWTIGSVATMTFDLQGTSTKDLLLRLHTNAYLGGNLEHQKIVVEVNGSEVASWQVSSLGWYEAVIPFEVVLNGFMRVVFMIDKPTSPCEVSNSNDCRSLGIAAHELIIYEQDIKADKHIRSEEDIARPVHLVTPYQIGSIIDFTQNGNSENYIRKGWGSQEQTHRWTIDPTATMSFSIEGQLSQQLLLRVNAHAYLGDQLKQREINVEVNGVKVASWRMNILGWYEAIIPAELSLDGVLQVSFKIAHAIAPCEVSDSKDCRKLGIAVREMTVISQGAR